MKNILLLLLLLPVMGFSQVKLSKDFDVSTGSPYPVVDAEEKYYLTIGDEIVMLKQYKKKTWVQKYSTTSKKLEYVKEYKIFGKDDVIEEFIRLKDRAIIFYSVWNKKKHTENLFYREIDLPTGTLSNPVKLITINGKLAGKHTYWEGGLFWKRRKVLEKFKVYTSYNREKLVVQYRKKPKIKDDDKNYDRIGMYVYDADINKQWGDEYKMPHTEALMDNLDYQVDSEGTVYLLSMVRKTKKSETSHIELLIFDGQVMDVIKLGEEKKSFKNMLLMENSEGEIYLTGLYGKSPKGYRLDGFFYSKVRDGNFESDLNYYPIPLNIVNQYQTKRKKRKNTKKSKKGKSLLDDLYLKKLISTEDGGTLLLGEEHYVKYHHNIDSKGRTWTTYTFHYESIYAMKLDSEGKMKWMKKLPKRQFGGEDKFNGMSFKYMAHEGKHYLLYLDNIKNSNLPISKIPAVHVDGKGGFFTAYVLEDKTGAVSKKNIVDFRKVPIKGEKRPKGVYQFSTDRVTKTSSGLVFEVYKKSKEDVMVHIDFK